MSVDLLLDTNMLLWMATGDPRAAQASQVLGDPSSTVAISAVSLAEVAIKHSIGKLPVDVATIRDAARRHGIQELPWDGNHAESLAQLPMHHRDPFDRMLIAQAQAEEMTIATTDTAFRAYDVGLFPSA